MEQLIMYVDGFNLYHGLHDWSGRRNLWLDPVSLARSLRPKSELTSVHYFTAPVLDSPASLSRQTTYLDAMVAAHPGLVTITRGRYQRRTLRCRRCGVRRIHYEEKETDVNIAVRLVADAARGSGAALLVSADSDLVPAINTARFLNPAMFIAAAFPPGRYSAHLAALMPASFHISKAKIVQSQLPRQVVDPRSGRTYERPPYWS